MKTFNEFVNERDKDYITDEEAKRRERLVLDAIEKNDKDWKEHPERFYSGEEFWKMWEKV